MLQILRLAQKSSNIPEEPQFAWNCASPSGDEGTPHPLWRDDIAPNPGPQIEFGTFSPPVSGHSYLTDIRTLGRFYRIGDMRFAPIEAIIHQAAHDRRHELTAQLREACRKVTFLLYGKTNRRLLMESRKILNLDRKNPIRKTPEFEEVARIHAQLEHEFRLEIECPIATRKLSKTALGYYAEIMQEERAAAQGRAYAFTLTRTFGNRSNLAQYLRNLGFTVYFTVGCKRIRLSGRTLEILHAHGLAVAKPGMKDPLGLLNLILGNTPTRKNPICRCKTWVQPIAPKNPDSVVAKRGGRAAALANGFAAYAVYMSSNFDQPCSMKNLHRYSCGGASQKLTKLEKSRIHPTKTRAELEALHKSQEAMRERLGMPRTGRQTWIIRNWAAIQESAPPPVYNYPAEVITRDGFMYELRPDWDMEFQTMGVRSVVCAYSRRLLWQEREADRIRLDLPPGSHPYETWEGECELDIMLHLCRFRRHIEIGESPECPIYSFQSVSGPVRPHADNLLPKDCA